MAGAANPDPVGDMARKVVERLEVEKGALSEIVRATLSEEGGRETAAALDATVAAVSVRVEGMLAARQLLHRFDRKPARAPVSGAPLRGPRFE